LRAWIGSCVVALVAVLTLSPASASPVSSGTVKVAWYTNAIISMTLTPNYNSGYGTVKATFGSQPAPEPGPGSCSNSCAVDFGRVEAGIDYIYKYAAHVNVASNDTSGFNLYGEGAANFSDGGANSMTLNQSLYWVPSVASGDANTGFTSGFPFNVTGGTVNPTQPEAGIPPTITYGAYPAPIVSSSSENGDIYQDYELKVPIGAATTSSGFVIAERPTRRPRRTSSPAARW